MGILLLSGCSQNPGDPTSVVNVEDPDKESTGGSETEPVVADLTNDSLIPPEEPTLSIESSPGQLNLSWSSTTEQNRVKLYQYDTLTHEERLFMEIDSSEIHSAKTPSLTHNRAWQREQIRVDICSADDCVSSQRMALTELAENSVQKLSPAVFIADEKFSDSFATNQDASLLAAALPKEGVIEIYLRNEHSWIRTQRISVADISPSDFRITNLAVSSSGNTLAALLNDTNSASIYSIKIIERLGEGWFEIDSWQVVARDINTTENTESTEQDNNQQTLKISENGERLMLLTSDATYLYETNETGWSEVQRFQDSDAGSSNVTFNENPDKNAVRRSMSANAPMSQLVSIKSLDQALWLNIWHEYNSEINSATWQKTATFRLEGFDAEREVIVQSNSEGNTIAVAGWEPASGNEQALVMWRYQISSSSESVSSIDDLTVIDSLRFPPTEYTRAQLRFSANNELTSIALGWQYQQGSGTYPDASLKTYQFDSVQRRWLPMLELPETIPTLAKQAFIERVLMAADGKTLLIGNDAGQTVSTTNRVGELLIFR